jgi:hypothetical protein
VGGLDGTVGAWFTTPEEGASSGSDKVATVQEELPEYESTIASLNAFRPGAGDEYLANLAAGSDKPIPYDAYKAGYRGPTGGGWTASWLAFQAANPDATIEEWDAWDYQQYAERRTLEIANEMATGVYVAQEPVAEEVAEAAVVEEEAPASQPAYLRESRPAPRRSLSDSVFSLLGMG